MKFTSIGKKIMNLLGRGEDAAEDVARKASTAEHHVGDVRADAGVPSPVVREPSTNSVAGEVPEVKGSAEVKNSGVLGPDGKELSRSPYSIKREEDLRKAREADEAAKKEAEAAAKAAAEARRHVVPLSDAIGALQPRRKVVEQLDGELGEIRKLARDSGVIDSTVTSSRTGQEVSGAVLRGEKVSPDEFNSFVSSQRSVAIRSEYDDTVNAMKRIKLSSKKTDTEAAFSRMAELRKDRDFTQVGPRSDASSVRGIEKDFFAGKEIDEGQFEKLRSFYNKHYFQDLGIHGTQAAPLNVGPGSSATGVAVSVGKQLLEKAGSSKAIWPSVSRSIEARFGLSLPGARYLVPGGLLAGLIGTNADYVLNGPSEPGLSVAQILPIGGALSDEPELTEAGQLNFMAFQRNPWLLKDPLKKDGTPNKFHQYYVALQENDEKGMRAAGLTKDQQDAVARVNISVKVPIETAGDVAKAEADRAAKEKDLQEKTAIRGSYVGAGDIAKKLASGTVAPSDPVITPKTQHMSDAEIKSALAALTGDSSFGLAGKRGELEKIVDSSHNKDGKIDPERFEEGMKKAGINPESRKVVQELIFAPR